jgi:hypothetical protein
VDAFDLVCADDDVLESGAVGKREDGIRVAALSLTRAADAAAVGLEATIERASDRHCLVEGLGALGCGNWNGSALGQAREAGGSLVGGAGKGSGSESQDGSSDGSLHVDGVGWDSVSE